jgi:hypothetical protein
VVGMEAKWDGLAYFDPFPRYSGLGNQKRRQGECCTVEPF